MYKSHDWYIAPFHPTGIKLNMPIQARILVNTNFDGPGGPSNKDWWSGSDRVGPGISYRNSIQECYLFQPSLVTDLRNEIRNRRILINPTFIGGGILSHAAQKIMKSVCVLTIKTMLYLKRDISVWYCLSHSDAKSFNSK